jgi:hypothetical protein
MSIEIIKPSSGGGGGIESLNGLTATDQFLAVGTSGTDFAISSSVDTNTFNLPTASAINRGALSSADWTTFNSKGNGTVTSVAALTLGTTGSDLSSTVATSTTTPVITLNVPTASATNRGALSSANWTTFNSKQDALVSGTNIKTINSTSILGSGNLVIAATPSGVSGAVQFSDGSALASDATNFFYDNTNDRLGLGINAPTARLHVKGSGATNATKSILAQNSASTETFSISDSGIGLISNSLGINGGVGGSTYLGQTMRLAVNDFSRFGDIRIGGSFASGLGYIQSDATNPIEFSASQIKFCNGWIASANVLKLGTTVQRGRIEINTLSDARAILIQADAAQSVPLVEFRNSANTLLSYIAAKGEFYFGSGTISASAAIQADSTTQGFLPPRMTTAQINAIVSPAEGLVAYNTTISHLCCYQGGAWVRFSHSPM